MAQQNCGLYSSGAHLVDIRNKEEHMFLASYLQSFSQVIMLWTGLNDMKVSIFISKLAYSDNLCESGRLESRISSGVDLPSVLSLKWNNNILPSQDTLKSVSL